MPGFPVGEIGGGDEGAADRVVDEHDVRLAVPDLGSVRVHEAGVVLRPRHIEEDELNPAGNFERGLWAGHHHCWQLASPIHKSGYQFG